MQCDSTISIEKEGRNSEKASVPSIDQISSTHFHSIFPFHFASSNPSFFIDPIASTISNKRFFFFIIHEFSHKHWNSIGSDGVVSISFELDHDGSFDLANDLRKLVPLPHSFQQHGSGFCVILDAPSFSFSLLVVFTVINQVITLTIIDVCPLSLFEVASPINHQIIINIIKLWKKSKTTFQLLHRLSDLGRRAQDGHSDVREEWPRLGKY